MSYNYVVNYLKDKHNKRKGGTQGKVPKFIFVPVFQEDLDSSENEKYDEENSVAETSEETLNYEIRDVHESNLFAVHEYDIGGIKNDCSSTSTTNNDDPKLGKCSDCHTVSTTDTSADKKGDDKDDDSPSDILHKFIYSSRWVEAMESLQADSTLSQCWKQVHNRHGKVMQSNLPIHLALKFQAHEDLIIALVDAYPEALKLTDEKGRTPLHLACLLKTKSALSVVNYLLDRYSGATTCRDNRGRLPLHLAYFTKHYNDDDHKAVVKKLIRMDPASIFVEDNEGNLFHHKEPTRGAIFGKLLVSRELRMHEDINEKARELLL